MQAIKLSEEPKRREWPFFTLMDVYFSDQVNDPSLRLFSSTKRFDTDTFDDKNFDEELQAVLAAANLNASMSSVLQNLSLGWSRQKFGNNNKDIDIEDKHEDDMDDTKSEVSINLSSKLLSNSLTNSNNNSTNDKNNNKSHLTSLNIPSNNNNNNGNNNNNSSSKVNVDHGGKNLSALHHHHHSLHHHAAMAAAAVGLPLLEKEIEPNNNTLNSNRNLMGSTNNSFSTTSEGSINSSRNSASSHANINDVEDYDDNMAHMRAYERNLKNINQKFLHEMNEHHNIDQYLLSWRGFHGNMCKGFHNLQRDGQMVDVTIAAGGKIFKAHKLVKKLTESFLN